MDINSESDSSHYLGRAESELCLGPPHIRGRDEEGSGECPQTHQEPQNQDGYAEPGGVSRYETRVALFQTCFHYQAMMTQCLVQAFSCLAMKQIHPQFSP